MTISKTDNIRLNWIIIILLCILITVLVIALIVKPFAWITYAFGIAVASFFLVYLIAIPLIKNRREKNE